jgi:hypothetical protein
LTFFRRLVGSRQKKHFQSADFNFASTPFQRTASVFKSGCKSRGYFDTTKISERFFASFLKVFFGFDAEVLIINASRKQNFAAQRSDFLPFWGKIGAI